MSALNQRLHNVLMYQWAEYSEALKVFPKNVADLRTRCVNAMLAFQNMPGTNEVLKEQERRLRRMGLRAEKTATQDCASTIISMLNGSTPSAINLAVGKMVLPVHGDQLVFAISNLIQVDIFYFSTRAQPRLITPRNPLASSLERPCIAILHHVDSYAGTSQWFNICVDESKTNVPLISSQGASSVSKPYPTPPAFSRSETGSTKSRKAPMKIDISNERLISTLEEHLKRYISNLYQTKVENGKEKFDNFFQKQLKLKNLPMVKQGVYDELFGDDTDKHPAAAWLSSTLRKIDGYDAIGRYREIVTTFQHQQMEVEEGSEEKSSDNNSNSGSSSSSGSSSGDDGGSIQQEGNTKTIQETKIETATMSLKALLREDVSFHDIKQRLEEEKSRLAMDFQSLSTCVGKAVDMLSKGELNQLCGYAQPVSSEIDIKDVAKDFDFGDGGTTTIAVAPVQSNVSSYQDQKLFEHEHFSNLLSGCVGNSINEGKERSVYKEIRKRLLPQLDQSDKNHRQFWFNPAAADMLTEFTTSFKKMWTRSRLERDLRVSILGLLRVRLAPQRLQRYIEYRRDAGKKKSEAKEASSNASLSQSQQKKQQRSLMRRIGAAVIKGRPSKVIQKLYARLVQLSEASTTTSIQSDCQSEREADDDCDPLNLPHAEEEFEEDVDEDKGEKSKDSTAKTLRALVAVLKRLLQSGSTGKVFTKEDITKAAFKGTTLSCEEATAAADIANFLNPFVPKNDALQEITVLNGVAIATIANVVVNLVQPQQNQWKLTPTSSQSRGLPLSSAALYQILRKEYEIPRGGSGGYISSVDQARKAKKELFQAFFDVEKMEQFLASRGLTPYWRIVYVDQWRIRIVGRRTVYRDPMMTRKKKKKKKVLRSAGKRKGGGSRRVNSKRHKGEAMDDAQVEAVDQELKETRLALAKARREHTKMERERADLGRAFREEKKKKKRWNSAFYSQLKEARKAVNDHYVKIDKLKEKSSRLAQQLYNMQRGSGNTESKTKLDGSKRKAASMIKQHIKGERTIALTGTDPGIVTTATIAIVPAAEHIRHIQDIASLETSDEEKVQSSSPSKHVDPSSSSQHGSPSFSSPNVELPLSAQHDPSSFSSPSVELPLSAQNDPSSFSSPSVELPLSAHHDPSSFSSPSVELPLSAHHDPSSFSSPSVELPLSIQHAVEPLATSFTPSHSSTQPQRSPHLFDEPSTTKSTQQKSSSQPTKTATVNLTAKLVSDRTFSTIHRRQREWRQRHKMDTSSTKQAKQTRTREIRRNRFYCKFGSNVRHKAAAAGEKKAASIINFYGSWTGRNSRIKGHARGGSQSKLQQRMNAPENDHLLVVDEYNTTKTCGSCLHGVELQWQRKKDDTFKRCKGAVNCPNPRCPRRLASNQTTKNRDASGAENIALSGLSRIMSKDTKPLPAFQRGGNTTAYELATPFQQLTTTGASSGH